jgi:hypothetical protein
MKNILLLLTFQLLFLFATTAQTKFKFFDIKEGDLNPVTTNSYFEKLISYDRENDRTYILKTEKLDDSDPRYFLLEYSSELLQISNLKINLKFGKRKRNYIDLFEFGGKFYLLSHLDDIKNNKFVIYIESINKVLMQLQSDLRPLSEISTKMNNTIGAFSYSISSDSTKLLVMANEFNEVKEIEKINLFCYNNKMEQLWNKTIPIAYDHELAYSDKIGGSTMIRQLIVDNIGNAYFIYPTYENTIQFARKQEVQNSYNLLAYSADSDEHSTIPVSLKYKYISDIAIYPILSEDSIPKVVVTGFYSETNTSFMTGTYYLSASGNDLSDTITHTYAFEVDFLKNFMSDKKAQKRKELYQYHLKNLVPLESGEIICIAEQSLSYNLANQDFGQNNNLIVSMYDKSGKQKWIKTIMKKQGGDTNSEPYNSFTVTTDESNKKIYIFFNDHPNNLFITDPKKIYSFSPHSPSVFSICPVDFDGGIVRKMLFTNDRKKTTPCPLLSTYTPNGELIILKVGYKSHNLVKIKLFSNQAFFENIMDGNK